MARYKDTAAAAERNRELGAERAADDPNKVTRAVRVVRHAVARGTLTVDELARAVATSAPAPSPEQIERLRALLPAVRPDQTDAASGREAA